MKFSSLLLMEGGGSCYLKENAADASFVFGIASVSRGGHCDAFSCFLFESGGQFTFPSRHEANRRYRKPVKCGIYLSALNLA